jgi:hypothetical protein
VRRLRAAAFCQCQNRQDAGGEGLKTGRLLFGSPGAPLLFVDDSCSELFRTVNPTISDDFDAGPPVGRSVRYLATFKNTDVIKMFHEMKDRP